MLLAARVLLLVPVAVLVVLAARLEVGGPLRLASRSRNEDEGLLIGTEAAVLVAFGQRAEGAGVEGAGAVCL
jgi:hypothetical protein